MKRVSRIIFMAGAFIASTGQGFCQRTTATIYGAVQDSSGAVIQNAAVTFTNEQTNAALTLMSNEVGEFSAPFIPVGRYTIKVEAKGFTAHAQKGVDLTAGQQIRYPVTLQ